MADPSISCMATVNDDEDYRRVLRNNEKKITTLINPTLLLPVLRANGLLSESEHQQLDEMPMLQNEANRRAQLREGISVLNSFIKALQEEGEHMGHKILAVQLLAELSNLKPAPLPPPRKMRVYRAHTLPQSAVKSQTEWHTPLTITRSLLNESGVSSAVYQVHI